MDNKYNFFREKLNETLDYWEDDIRNEDVTSSFQEELKELIERKEPFKLYRYTPAEYFPIRNIETQRIHLSPNGKMNDIYEGLPSNVSKELTSVRLRELDDLAYMTCMSEDNSNILMWSHYADSNRGICVEYDLQYMVNGKFDIINHIFPVLYKEKRYLTRNIDSLIESHCYLKECIRDNAEYGSYEDLEDILPLFVTKGKIWEYEKEWRIIYTKKDMYDIDDDTLFNLNIPFPCITGVYLGYRIDPEVRNDISEICKKLSKESNRDIKVYQSTLSPENYKIDYQEIG